MIVFAPNVHTGGGKVLLNELIANRTFGEITHLYLDSRYFNENLPNKIKTYYFKPTVRERISAQFHLKRLLEERRKNQVDDEILFFGNLPPLFRLNNKTYLYLQNCFLLPGIKLPRDSWKVYLRNFVERLILRASYHLVDEIWVQSQWMVEICKHNFPATVVKKKPFVPSLPPLKYASKVYDLISVTSPAAHKNLRTLVTALQIMDSKLKAQIKMILILDSALSPHAFELPILKKITVEVKTMLSRRELFDYYAKSRISVITSSYESFCLPLYESLHFGLVVLALKAPYTNDVAECLNFYDSNDPIALANALLNLLDS